ncbi:ATP-binding protein [Aggregatibacter actinomycetemcomitans]|uniref:ATP-binding protein n=1 Tax=Aggregatibacter actinomycetemcomitans TaxID=714 RepID=UPI0006A70C98|nr:ATP-binding protein [Aggregatibacter actinomycetemcomitans]KOE65258.1 ATPase [Aggregatibacter actinomycetemcomitans serotype e str. A160]KOE67692.1 ATPase [Aggregatibacter actinomycetemcomitans serotype e str. SCC393]KYK80579.1 ATPase [Aggregatibacter actinomycetemcomitans serotype e str. SA2876]
MYLSRQIQPLVSRLLKQFPAVLVTGARQVGKSTLLKHIAKDYAYLTFDDPLLLEQAKQEPRLFFLNHAGNVILDEVQYAQELFSLLKLEIDKQQKNGMFLLSGSQAFELMQNVSETLAGRIAILKLQGLSLREILNVEFYLPFIPSRDYLASREKMLKSPENIWQIIHKGDMPRLYQQETDWEIYYSSYVSTYIERDVRQLTNITNTTDFTRFMVALASRSGELLNYSNVAQEVGVSNETIKRWTAILQTSGIIYLLQPYSNNHLKRTIKTPKIYFLNTGLMAYLTKWLTPETISKGAKSSQFFESFVVSEIIKSFTNNGIEPPLYFYRNTNQKEIDLIIEYNRTIYPIEIKTTANPNKKMAKSFALLNSLGKESTIGLGVIINQYPNKHYLAENLVALPVRYL